MSYVDDAFEKMRQASEITQREEQQAQSRHRRIRDTLEGEWDLTRSFLTGSYDRHTKIKPLQDVDIFAVIDPDGNQGGYRQQAPSQVIGALAEHLDGKFKGVQADGMAVRITMSDDEGQATFEVVPAFEHPSQGFEAPDPDRGRWIRTDPKAHATLTSRKNEACGGKWVPFVKMLKGWNLESRGPVPQSFLIEVMALQLVKPPFGRYQDEIAAFFGNLIDHVDTSWPDPAGVGPDIDEMLTRNERHGIRAATTQALEVAEEAIYLEDEGQERKAVEQWRALFQARMPRP